MELEGSSLSDVLAELTSLPEEAPTKREACSRCRRPLVVCVCSCFPTDAIPIQSRVIILQHPNEESRCLATVPLLRECIPKDRCHIVKGKRFGLGKNELLDKALQSPNTLLLYPGKNAVDIDTLPQMPVGAHDGSALVVLDGTWAQAKSMYVQNLRLQSIKQVQLSTHMTVQSEYVIRTQPTKTCLSTLECIAHTLSWLEQRPDIVETAVRPLRALCQHQLDHGAVAHHSKDDPEYISREMRAILKKSKVAEKKHDRTE